MASPNATLLLHLLATSLLTLACAPAAPAGAEEGAAARLAPISVTATRSPMRSFEFPGMVTVTGRDEVVAAQPSTADDLLRSVPNVELTGGPRRTGQSPSVRGFDGADVVILLDGARQNFGSAHDGRFFVDPRLLREVEVLRGPASSLYGSGGNGGVLEFRTVRAEDLLRPGEHAGASLTGAWQSVNRERSGTFIGYARPSESLDLLGAVTRLGSGAIELGDGSTLRRSDDDILSGLLKGTLRLAEHHRIEASFQHFGNDAEEPNNGQGSGGPNLVDKAIRSDNWRIAYDYRHPGNDLVDLDLLAYRNETSVDERRLDGNGAGPVGEVLERDVDTTGLRLDNRSRARLGEAALTLTYGAEAYRDRQDGAAGAGERDGVPDAEADFLGAFVQAELHLPSPLGVPGDLLLLPAVRYDRFEVASALAREGSRDHEISPRLGASWLPTDWLMLFASRSRAFRAPTFNEAFLTGTHFTIPIGPATIVNRFVPNPDLRAQRTDTWELGAGVSLRGVLAPGDALEVKGAYFRTEGEDFIDLRVEQPVPFVDCLPFIPGACDGTTTSANVAEAVLYGRELEARYENRRLRLRLGVSTLDGKNPDTGARLGVLTPPELHLDLGLKLPERDALIGWRLRAASEFDQVNTPAERRDGYTVHDFYLAWTPRDGALAGLRLDLGVDNAFDEDYSRVFTGSPEPGRNLKASLSYRVGW